MGEMIPFQAIPVGCENAAEEVPVPLAVILPMEKSPATAVEGLPCAGEDRIMVELLPPEVQKILSSVEGLGVLTEQYEATSLDARTTPRPEVAKFFLLCKRALAEVGLPLRAACGPENPIAVLEFINRTVRGNQTLTPCH